MSLVLAEKPPTAMYHVSLMKRIHSWYSNSSVERVPTMKVESIIPVSLISLVFYIVAEPLIINPFNRSN